MGFLGSIFGGENKTLDSDIKKLGSLAGYETGIGEADTTAPGKNRFSKRPAKTRSLELEAEALRQVPLALRPQIAGTSSTKPDGCRVQRHPARAILARRILERHRATRRPRPTSRRCRCRTS